MAKFKLTSWLKPKSSSRSDTERKETLGTTTSSAPTASPSKTEDRIQRTGSNATGPDSTTSNKTESTTSEMILLAQKIAKDAEKLEAYMQEHELGTPSFDVDAPADFPKLPADMSRTRMEIIHASKNLQDLLRGPREGLRWGIWAYLDVLAVQIVNHFGLAKLFPVDETIALADLQAKTSLDAVNLARVLRQAMTLNIFWEPEPGVIGHTASSRLLAEDEDMQAWLGFNAEDNFPSAGHVLQALQAYPEATSLTRTGFNFAFDTVDREPMFVTFGKNPQRARRMGRAMASLTGGEGYEIRYLVEGGYDFGPVDARAGTLVDVGGSHGFVCVDLARKYRNMRFVVQDLPKTVESAPRPVDADEQVAARIEFQPHDFFTEQPVKNADVYFFRWIMHNYSTPYAIKILKGLVPAMKPGARVVINDHCLRSPGEETPWDEKLIRTMDMVMLTLLNAQERTEAEFRALFAAADERYAFKGVTRPSGCRMSIVEAVWQPDAATEEK